MIRLLHTATIISILHLPPFIGLFRRNQAGFGRHIAGVRQEREA
jgi:hypothetical protein